VAEDQAAAASKRSSATAAEAGNSAKKTTKSRLMLLNDLFLIEEVREDGFIDLLVRGDHPIFSGHFPGQPILPGACQVQLVHEMLTHVTGKKWLLSKADQIKFLTMLDPRQHDRLRLSLSLREEAAGGLRVVASLLAGGKAVLKFNGIFQAA
jgi:3-hydroxyacyl-[acyl-carrier-protein] dehydratase